jgi:uncharacterized metal-binding protein
MLVRRILRSALIMTVWLTVWSLASRWLSSERMAPTREDHRYILFLTGVAFGGAFLALVDAVYEAAKRRRGNGPPAA